MVDLRRLLSPQRRDEKFIDGIYSYGEGDLYVV